MSTLTLIVSQSRHPNTSNKKMKNFHYESHIQPINTIQAELAPHTCFGSSNTATPDLNFTSSSSPFPRSFSDSQPLNLSVPSTHPLQPQICHSPKPNPETLKRKSHKGLLCSFSPWFLFSRHHSLYPFSPSRVHSTKEKRKTKEMETKGKVLRNENGVREYP